MAAIMEPVLPEIDQPGADASEQPTQSRPPEDSIPLEAMTWPELKRVAREYDLKLNVKKSVLIRQIREARQAVVKDQAYRETFRGRMEERIADWRYRLDACRDGLVAWWKSDSNPDAKEAPSESTTPGMSPGAKAAIWVGAILAGGAAAVIAALV